MRYAERSIPGAIGRGVALDPQVDRHARLAHLLDEIDEVAQARLRRERQLVVGAAQHAEQAAHLGQRRATGRLDRREDLGRGSGRSAPIARRSAPACTTMIETLCATTSCSSRAIRARSSATASLAFSSRSCSSSTVRAASAAGELLAAAHDGGRAPDGEQDAADEDDVADDVLADRDRHEHGRQRR